jgi:hypothetical protein
MGEAEESGESTTADSTATALDSTYAQINLRFDSVKSLMQGACFDCHSQQTDFPWYHSLPLIGSWMDGHVRKGRNHLDMTNGFPFETRMSLANALEKIKTEIQGGDMPIWSYRLMHSRARLSDAEKDSIYNFVDESLELLAAHGIKPKHRSRDRDED